MINVKELMIGDYVDVGADGCPPAVAVVEEIYGKANRALLSICKSSVTFDAKDISPIKLTEEFFLKNGYAKLYRDRHVTRLYNRNNIRMTVDIFPPENYVRFSVDGIEINYVHEFQHYLRLVNLSDYANNLKI